MIEIYKCDICQKEFKSKPACLAHEKKHFDSMPTEDIIKLQCKNDKKNLCDFCIHVYYTYNSKQRCDMEDVGETDCKKLNYKYFKLQELAKMCFERKQEE